VLHPSKNDIKNMFIVKTLLYLYFPIRRLDALNDLPKSQETEKKEGNDVAVADSDAGADADFGAGADDGAGAGADDGAGATDDGAAALAIDDADADAASMEDVISSKRRSKVKFTSKKSKSPDVNDDEKVDHQWEPTEDELQSLYKELLEYAEHLQHNATSISDLLIASGLLNRAAFEQSNTTRDYAFFRFHMCAFVRAAVLQADATKLEGNLVFLF
jgi:DNA-binding transcriptional MerR regulator